MPKVPQLDWSKLQPPQRFKPVLVYEIKNRNRQMKPKDSRLAEEQRYHFRRLRRMYREL